MKVSIASIELNRKILLSILRERSLGSLFAIVVFTKV